MHIVRIANLYTCLTYSMFKKCINGVGNEAGSLAETIQAPNACISIHCAVFIGHTTNCIPKGDRHDREGFASVFFERLKEQSKICFRAQGLNKNNQLTKVSIPATLKR